MTQEEKQILLKDLCGRLPYGVMCEDTYGNSGSLFELVPELNVVALKINKLGSVWTIDIERIKPYLRPKTSMTESEEFTYEYKKKNHTEWEAQDYLNSIHIDYRGLIPMGLALPAPEGIYGKEDKQ